VNGFKAKNRETKVASNCSKFAYSIVSLPCSFSSRKPMVQVHEVLLRMKNAPWHSFPWQKTTFAKYKCSEKNEN
jgi:hypothetical protein